MRPIWTILRRELGAYFSTPIGYVIVCFFLMVSCYFYVQENVFVTGQATMRPFFSLLPMIFLFFVPAISMRLWAEERELGTLELLMTFPVRTWQVVLAKFLGALAFLAVMMALTLHIPLVLSLLAPPNTAGLDWGEVLGGYAGSLVLGMVYLSAGSLGSSLTRDQIVAFVVGLALCAGLFLIGYPTVLSTVKDLWPEAAATLPRFGVVPHFESISRGVVDTRDIIYAATVCGFFLLLNVVVIERKR